MVKHYSSLPRSTQYQLPMSVVVITILAHLSHDWSPDWSTTTKLHGRWPEGSKGLRTWRLAFNSSSNCIMKLAWHQASCSPWLSLLALEMGHSPSLAEYTDIQICPVRTRLSYTLIRIHGCTCFSQTKAENSNFYPCLRVPYLIILNLLMLLVVPMFLV